MTKLSAVLLAILLTGCTLTPKTPAPASVYDLGAAPITAPGSAQLSPVVIQTTNISAPVWLDTEAIYYRLAYHDPARIYTYANSHWVAPPAKLLTEYLKQYLANHQIDPSPGENKQNQLFSDHLLRMELSEFTQIFDTQDSSQVTIRLRASLYASNMRRPIAQHDFTVMHPAQTADAAGAVAAFVLASDSLGSQLVQWLSNSNQWQIP